MNQLLKNTSFLVLLVGLSFSSIGQSLVFNGTSYVSVPNSPSLNLGTGTFTFEASFKASSTGGGSIQVFLSNRKASETSGLMFGLYDGELFFQLGGVGPNYIVSGINLRDDKCHHVAVSRDGTGKLVFYIDGLKKQESTSANSISSTSNYYISYDVRNGINQFIGSIDEIRIWNVQRSDANIAAYANVALENGAQTGLAALWKFNEGQGQTATDNSGNQLNAVLGSTASIDNTDPTWAAVGCLAEKNNNHGLTFNGAQRAKVPFSDSLNLGTGPFTFEASVKASSTGESVQMILSNRVAGKGIMFGLYNGQLFTQLGGQAPNIGAGQGQKVNDDLCHHVAITRTASGILTFYVDGTAYYNTTSVSSISSTGYFFMGYDNLDNEDYFSGSMDEIRIWKIARSASDIAAFKDKPLSNPATTAGLVALWNLNEGTGQIAQDISKNALHATLGDSSKVENDDPTWSALTCVSSPLSLQDNEAFVASPISVYPNPFEEELFVSSPLSSLRAAFYSTTGELVQGEKGVANNAPLKLDQQLPAGMYVLKVTNGETARFFKVMKK